MKTFTKDISDQPITGIKRVIKFLQFSKFDLNNSVPVIQAEFGIMHSLNGMALPQLDKSIFITGDGTGEYLPTDMDLDAQGNVIGLDSELINDIEFTTNWLWNDKGMSTFYSLIIKIKDVKEYNINGEKYISGDKSEYIYSAIDLKYYGVIN